jgi:hypothetical protein
MKHFAPHITVLVVLVYFTMPAFSQPVTVSAAANRNRILIGEPIELKLEARVPAAITVKWFATDSIPHFEYIDKGKIDTINGNNEITYRQTLTLTSFDSGRWHIASLPLEIGNKSYLTDSLPVSVAFSNFDPSKDYHDIKDILEAATVQLGYISWILGALTLLALLLILYFLRKKASVTISAPAIKPVSRLSPLQEALEALGKLCQHTPADPPAIKTFHIQLNNILRHFIYRKTGTATMEKTSSDLMIALKGIGLPGDSFTRLAQAMRMNDAVKFAKYLPAAEENETSFSAIKQSIEELDKKIL